MSSESFTATVPTSFQTALNNKAKGLYLPDVTTHTEQHGTLHKFQNLSTLPRTLSVSPPWSSHVPGSVSRVMDKGSNMTLISKAGNGWGKSTETVPSPTSPASNSQPRISIPLITEVSNSFWPWTKPSEFISLSEDKHSSEPSSGTLAPFGKSSSTSGSASFQTLPLGSVFGSHSMGKGDGNEHTLSANLHQDRVHDAYTRLKKYRTKSDQLRHVTESKCRMLGALCVRRNLLTSDVVTMMQLVQASRQRLDEQRVANKELMRCIDLLTAADNAAAAGSTENTQGGHGDSGLDSETSGNQ